MDEAFDSRLEFDEGPEICDARDGAGNPLADRVALGPAYADDRRGLVEHVGRQITESEHARAKPRHAKRCCANLDELAAIQSGTVGMVRVLLVVLWHGRFKRTEDPMVGEK